MSIPFQKKHEVLTALRVIVLAHLNGTLKLQTNFGAILPISLKINLTLPIRLRQMEASACRKYEEKSCFLISQKTSANRI
ncbi:MAG TPA: hypothetical protein VGC66_19060 [Pyrinomonadaceae bacterium]